MGIDERDLAFDEWYQKAWPRLVTALTFSFAGDNELACDAASEACARALLHWRRIAKKGDPSAWAFTVGLNYGKRHRRRQGIESRALERIAHPQPDRDAESAVGDLDEAIAALAPQQRKAILLRYVLDLSQADTARALGVAPGTAAATLNQARSRLRQILNAKPDLWQPEMTDQASADVPTGAEDARPR